MKCYKCGGHLKLIMDKPLYNGRTKKRTYACMMCGTRMRLRERMSDEEWAKKNQDTYACDKTIETCLNCPYEECLLDSRSEAFHPWAGKVV